MVCHDPPVFAIGITGNLANAKDTLANIASSKECVLNIISEHFVEAANATSVNAPYGVSEWGLSGLHQAPSSLVKPARVQEAIFSVECKLMELKEFDSKANPGKKSGTLMLLEGVNFWVRDDAINEERNMIDPLVRRLLSFKPCTFFSSTNRATGFAASKSSRWHHVRPPDGRLRDSAA